MFGVTAVINLYILSLWNSRMIGTITPGAGNLRFSRAEDVSMDVP